MTNNEVKVQDPQSLKEDPSMARATSLTKESKILKMFIVMKLNSQMDSLLFSIRYMCVCKHQRSEIWQKDLINKSKIIGQIVTVTFVLVSIVQVTM